MTPAIGRAPTAGSYRRNPHPLTSGSRPRCASMAAATPSGTPSSPFAAPHTSTNRSTIARAASRIGFYGTRADEASCRSTPSERSANPRTPSTQSSAIESSSISATVDTRSYAGGQPHHGVFLLRQSRERRRRQLHDPGSADAPGRNRHPSRGIHGRGQLQLDPGQGEAEGRRGGDGVGPSGRRFEKNGCARLRVGGMSVTRWRNGSRKERDRVARPGSSM